MSQFLTITRLYEVIGKEFEAGAEQVRVQDDPSGAYPEYVVVDPLLRAIEDEQFFEVSQYVVLQR